MCKAIRKEAFGTRRAPGHGDTVIKFPIINMRYIDDRVV
ncbi:hypothetical protein D3OALGB2SA_4146 [Olavius algarvensis associated proteobacterium Delta 3]|nr:hypothetical protein D3OALGB2SA_4146 [Olavius algarvensis associated proteobacterium Delta 3]